jgi:potassium channel subfamily K
MSTIDPGVDERIKQSAENVEDDDNDAQKERGDTRDAVAARQPSRWWFASTACPLLAGTFGKFHNRYIVGRIIYLLTISQYVSLLLSFEIVPT